MAMPSFLGLLPTTELGDVVYFVEQKALWKHAMKKARNRDPARNAKFLKLVNREISVIKLHMIKGANCFSVEDTTLTEAGKRCILEKRRREAAKIKNMQDSRASIGEKRKAEQEDNGSNGTSKKRKVDETTSTMSSQPGTSKTNTSHADEVNAYMAPKSAIDISIPKPVTIEQVEAKADEFSCIFCAGPDGTSQNFNPQQFEDDPYTPEDRNILCYQCEEEVNRHTCVKCNKLFHGDDAWQLDEMEMLCRRCFRSELWYEAWYGVDGMKKEEGEQEEDGEQEEEGEQEEGESSLAYLMREGRVDNDEVDDLTE